MKADINFNEKTKLNDWWKEVKSLFEAVINEINAAENRRVAGEASLNRNINNEAQNRRNGDDNLQTNINSLSNSTRTSLSEIEKKISALKDADTNLQNNIDNGIIVRAEKDEELRRSIVSEATARQNEDNQIKKSIEELRQEINGLIRVKFALEGDLPPLSIPDPQMDIVAADIDLSGMFTVNGVKCGTMKNTTVTMAAGGKRYIKVSFDLKTHEISLAISQRISGYNIENNILTFTLGYYEAIVYINDNLDSPHYGECYIGYSDSCIETRELQCV